MVHVAGCVWVCVCSSGPRLQACITAVVCWGMGAGEAFKSETTTEIDSVKAEIQAIAAKMVRLTKTKESSDEELKALQESIDTAHRTLVDKQAQVRVHVSHGVCVLCVCVVSRLLLFLFLFLCLSKLSSDLLDALMDG